MDVGVPRWLHIIPLYTHPFAYNPHVYFSAWLSIISFNPTFLLKVLAYNIMLSDVFIGALKNMYLYSQCMCLHTIVRLSFFAFHVLGVLPFDGAFQIHQKENMLILERLQGVQNPWHDKVLIYYMGVSHIIH